MGIKKSDRIRSKDYMVFRASCTSLTWRIKQQDRKWRRLLFWPRAQLERHSPTARPLAQRFGTNSSCCQWSSSLSPQKLWGWLNRAEGLHLKNRHIFVLFILPEERIWCLWDLYFVSFWVGGGCSQVLLGLHFRLRDYHSLQRWPL